MRGGCKLRPHMPDTIVDIHPDVLALDVQEIANYIAQDNEEAAARVLEAIDQTGGDRTVAGNADDAAHGPCS